MRPFRRVLIVALFSLILFSPHPAAAQLWVQGPQLSNPTAQADAQFGQESGWGVAMSADGAVVAIGAPYENHGGWRRGALHIFRKNGEDSYALHDSIVGTMDGEQVGSVVKMSGDGNTILLTRGSPPSSFGSARVYRYADGSWHEGGGVGCFGTGSGVLPGYSLYWMLIDAQLTFDGSLLACGGDGRVRLTSTADGASQDIPMPVPFGQGLVRSVGISADGNTIVAGAPTIDATVPGNARGAAFLLVRDGASWQIKKLVASDRAFEDFFGISASISGDGKTIYVANKRRLSSTHRGKLYAFVRGDSGWPAGDVITETRQVPTPTLEQFDSIGEHMAMSHDGRLLAATVYGSSFFARGGWLFDASTQTWTQTTPISNCNSYYAGGMRPPYLSADGRTLLISSSNYCENGAPGGAAWLFTRRDTPPPPVGLEVRSVVGNTVTLGWLPPAGVPLAGNYVVEGGILPGQVLASLPTNRATPTFTFVAPDGAFYIRVHAIFAGMRSDASNEVRLYVNVPTVPPTPTNLLGAVNGSQVALSWISRQTTEVTGIKLHVAGPVSGTLTLPPGEAFTFPTVPDGSYTFSVSAFNRAGESGLSNTIALDFPSTCTGPPQPPTRFTGARDPGFASLSWDPPSSGPAATSYILLVHQPFSAALPLTQRSISGPVPAGRYFLQVVAVNPCGTSQPTSALEMLVP